MKNAMALLFLFHFTDCLLSSIIRARKIVFNSVGVHYGPSFATQDSGAWTATGCRFHCLTDAETYKMREMKTQESTISAKHKVESKTVRRWVTYPQPPIPRPANKLVR
jgi:hypothetical protein